jgi:hypothetical protein
MLHFVVLQGKVTMEAVSTYETLVSSCETSQYNIPDYSHLHTWLLQEPDISPNMQLFRVYVFALEITNK